MSSAARLDRVIYDLMDSIIWSPTDAEAKALGTFSYREINEQRTEVLRTLIKERDEQSSRPA